METLEMPVAEELEEISAWGEGPPVRFDEQEMDIAAFELWRQASRDDLPADEDL